MSESGGGRRAVATLWSVMLFTRLPTFASVALLLVSACSGSSTGSGSSGASSGDPTAACNEAHDGSSACGSTTCAGGKFCLATSFCQVGCKNQNNCPRGSRCDMSAADGDGIGTCRPCTDKPTIDAGTADAAPPLSCNDRCHAKATTCGASTANASSLCTKACATATDAQLTCLENTACATLTKGGTICGVDFEGGGGE